MLFPSLSLDRELINYIWVNIGTNICNIITPKEYISALWSKPFI
jgi:hypothetical protein